MKWGWMSRRCDRADAVAAYALEATPGETESIERHIGTCSQCREQLDALRPLVDSFVHWPTDVLRPSGDLSKRLAQRMTAQAGTEFPLPPTRDWNEPRWEQVAPGITCKVLATDVKNDRVSMLVHLEPGVAYPPHKHAGLEELHLLDGELWIEDRKLLPGDYNRAECGTSDERVYSETGCTCVLITSYADMLA